MVMIDKLRNTWNEAVLQRIMWGTGSVSASGVGSLIWIFMFLMLEAEAEPVSETFRIKKINMYKALEIISVLHLRQPRLETNY